MTGTLTKLRTDAQALLCIIIALCLVVAFVPAAPAYAEGEAGGLQGDVATGDAATSEAAVVDLAAVDGGDQAGTTLSPGALSPDGEDDACESPSAEVPEGFALEAAVKMRALGADGVSPRSVQSGTWGSLRWSLDDATGTLTISGSGAMPAQTGSDTPGYANLASQVTKIVVQEGVTALGDAVFYQMYRVQQVELPSTLTSIGAGAFAYCYSLESVNIPARVSSVGAYAFQETSLASVSLPAALTSLDSLAFFRCSSLQSLSVDGGNRAYKAVSGVLYSKDGKTLYLYPSGKAGQYSIPSGATRIGANAFAESAVQGVSIPSTVTAIDDGAFAGSALTSVAFPNSVTSVGYYVFEGCANLRSASMGTGLKKLNYRMFFECSSLASVDLGRVTDLDRLAFGYCTSLTRIVIPQGTTAILNGTFGYCTALQSVSIPSTVKEIAYQAFLGCSALTSVTLPEGLEKIYRYSFALCTGLKTVRIPSTVTHIGEEAFPASTKLTNIPAGLTRMEDGSYSILAKVAMRGKEMYSYAFQVLDRVNAERKKRGLKALSMDKNLLDAAMQRAMETTLYWSHTRPNGTDCFTVSSLMVGENIAAGQSSPKAVMTSWMNSPGHRANILTDSFTTIGVGCVQVGNRLYWVQCFGSNKATAASKGSYKDANKTRNVFVSPEKPYYQPAIKFSSTRLKKKGATAKVTCTWNNGFAAVTVPATSLVYKSSKSSAVSAAKGVLKAKKSSGSATVRVYFPGYEKGAVSKTITISALATPTLKAVKNVKGKKAKVTWKKVADATGYQVYYSTSKQFKGAKKTTVKKGKTVTKTLTKLKKGKTYYVKVRAYKKVGKKTQYSAWSNVKKVKIKK